MYRDPRFFVKVEAVLGLPSALCPFSQPITQKEEHNSGVFQIEEYPNSIVP